MIGSCTALIDAIVAVNTAMLALSMYSNTAAKGSCHAIKTNQLYDGSKVYVINDLGVSYHTFFAAVTIVGSMNEGSIANLIG